MTNNSKSDRNLTKLKLALVAGGLAATIIGADLLGNEAAALTGDTAANAGSESAITNSVDSAVTIDSAIPEDLELDLEAIPTVSAPTIRSARVAMGRASG